MNMLTLLADENMPLIDELFGDFCWIERKAGRDITKKDLQDVDILLVRSVTQVNQELLEGSPVKFVGTATIGTDHIDIDYLEKNDIAFADAAGCNAQAVAEYVLAAIAYWAYTHKIDVKSSTVGIIGAGNVGTCLTKMLDILGINYLLNDPLLETAGDPRKFVSLDRVNHCHIVTCHVPLTMEGEHSTYHLIDEKFFQFLPKASLLINSSRGAVVDNQAALRALRKRLDLDLVLDVWEGEPELSAELLKRCLLGTPHIAGYSLEGKIRGSHFLYQKLRQWLGKEALITLSSKLPHIDSWHRPKRMIDLHNSIKSHYDIEEDSDSLKALADMELSQIVKEFDLLRKNYKNRLEYYRENTH